MCCLKYEQDAYEDLMGRAPKVGAVVETPGGQGIVMELNILREIVKVKLDKGNETDLEVYKMSEIKVIKDVAAEEDIGVDIETLKQLEELS
jgi:cell fate regulator YaaT (PSP1 superfamily)